MRTWTPGLLRRNFPPILPGVKRRIIAAICLCFAGFLTARGSDLTPTQAMAKAEAWLQTSGLLDSADDALARVPANQRLNGNINPKAWGYRRTTDTPGWEILFLVQATPVPKIKGNETAYAIRVIVTGKPETIYRAHGVATAYDGKPFGSYTAREPSQ